MDSYFTASMISSNNKAKDCAGGNDKTFLLQGRPMYVTIISCVCVSDNTSFSNMNNVPKFSMVCIEC